MLFLKIKYFVDFKNQDIVKFDNPRFFVCFLKIKILASAKNGHFSRISLQRIRKQHASCFTSNKRRDA